MDYTGAAAVAAPAAAAAAAAATAAAGVVWCVCSRWRRTGGRDTLRSAADATWQSAMNYGRSRVPTATRCCTTLFCKNFGKSGPILTIFHSLQICYRITLWNLHSKLYNFTAKMYLSALRRFIYNITDLYFESFTQLVHRWTSDALLAYDVVSKNISGAAVTKYLQRLLGLNDVSSTQKSTWHGCNDKFTNPINTIQINTCRPTINK